MPRHRLALPPRHQQAPPEQNDMEGELDDESYGSVWDQDRSSEHPLFAAIVGETRNTFSRQNEAVTRPYSGAGYGLCRR